MGNSTLIIDYLGEGLAADRPATLSISTSALGIYYATDTRTVSVWNGSGWDGLVAELASFLPGVVAAGARVRLALTGPITLPAGLTGSEATARVAAASAVTVTLNKISGGTTTAIGSISWAAGNTAGTFTLAEATSFAPGDLIEELWPTPADATLADVAITLRASRQ